MNQFNDPLNLIFRQPPIDEFLSEFHYQTKEESEEDERIAGVLRFFSRFQRIQCGAVICVSIINTRS